MSQRNPNNDRYKDGGKKGVTRKSAGTAKPKSTAGSSVYVASKVTTDKRKEEERKEKLKRDEAKEKVRDKEIIAKGDKIAADYKYYRNVWIAFIVVAIVAVVTTFISPRTMVEGGALAMLAPWQPQIQIAGLVIGYGALIAAFIVDWRKMRPVRKAKYAHSKGVKESKKQRAHREAAEAAKAEKKGFFSFLKK